MKTKLSTITLALLITFSSLAGGGWTPEKGNGFFMLSYRFIGGSYLANSSSMIGTSPFASVSTANLYGEYGITNRLCGIVYTPFFTAATQQAGIDEFNRVHVADQASGFGDVDLALKYKFYDGDIKVAGSFWAGINSGNYNAGTTGRLHLGDGDFSQMLRVDASGAFKSFWWTVFGGFNNRTNNFSDEIRFGGEFGYKRNRFMALLKVNANYSLYNGTQPDTYSPGIYSNNIEYLGVGPQFLYKFDNNLGLMAEAGFAFQARNIIASPSLSVGVFYDLKRKK